MLDHDLAPPQVHPRSAQRRQDLLVDPVTPPGLGEPAEQPHLVDDDRRLRPRRGRRALAHDVRGVLVLQPGQERPQLEAILLVEPLVAVQPEDPVPPRVPQRFVARRGEAVHPRERSTPGHRSGAATAAVASVEPVSTTTISSTRSATDPRHAARWASSFLTIMHKETRGRSVGRRDRCRSRPVDSSRPGCRRPLTAAARIGGRAAAELAQARLDRVDGMIPGQMAADVRRGRRALGPGLVRMIDDVAQESRRAARSGSASQG